MIIVYSDFGGVYIICGILTPGEKEFFLYPYYGSPLEVFTTSFGLCKDNFVWWVGLPTYFTSITLQFIVFFLIATVYLTVFLFFNNNMNGTAFLTSIVVNIYKFVKGLVISQVENFTLTPLIFTVFSLIFLGNLCGMIPYSSTITAQLIVTIYLSFFGFCLINFRYIIDQKLHSLEVFLPSGTPLFIVPFLIQIEVISYFSRVISLSVRIFANMVSGHTLLKILSGFCVGLLLNGGISSLIAFFPLVVIFLVTGLEFMIAGLQTYVFVVLFLIYTHELEISH